MLFSHFHRYLLMPILAAMLFADVIVAAHGLEVGDRVFDSALAKDLKYTVLFHGKVNLLVAHHSDPDHKSMDKTLVEEYKARFDILLAWRQMPNPEEGLVLIDKSGYVRWKNTDIDIVGTDDVIREELAKLKRDIPLFIGSSARILTSPKQTAKHKSSFQTIKERRTFLLVYCFRLTDRSVPTTRRSSRPIENYSTKDTIPLLWRLNRNRSQS